MAKQLKVGDIVVFRYYNNPEGKFYGGYKTGTIVEIDETAKYSNIKKFKVEHKYGSTWLREKEIKNRT